MAAMNLSKWYTLGLLLFIILIYCMHDRGGLHFLFYESWMELLFGAGLGLHIIF